MSQRTHCEHCGASLKQYWHRLTPGLTKALIKFHGGVISKRENRVHLTDDLRGINELTKTEYNNFQKLRFHGLVAKYRENGVALRGYWLLTKRGNAYLKDKISIPASVLTFHNKVIGHSPERVTIEEVMHKLDLPHFEDLGSIQWQLGDSDVEDETGELNQAALFEEEDVQTNAGRLL